MRSTLLSFTSLLAALHTLAGAPAAHAAEYEINLEEVLLTEPWGAAGEPPYPTHAILDVRVVRDGELLDHRLVGRGPEDANVWTWAEPALQGDGDGWVGVLTAGVPRRPDPWRFLVSRVEVPADATLEIGVILARATWFTEQPFEPSDWDKQLIAAYAGAAGAFFGGAFGALAGQGAEELFGWLADALGPEVEVIPCWGLMRDDRHDFSGAQLGGGSRVTVAPTGGHQWHGCPRPHIGYTLDISRVSFDFPVVTPGPCKLVPVTDDPRFAPPIATDWGDTWSAEIITRLAEQGGASVGLWTASTEEDVWGTSVTRDAVDLRPTAARATPFRTDRVEDDWTHLGPFASSPWCSTLENVDPDPWSSWTPFTLALAPSLISRFSDWIDILLYLEATTWTIAPDTTVQLYAEQLNGRTVGHRLRYTRTAADGRVLTDLMLSPSHDPPK